MSIGGVNSSTNIFKWKYAKRNYLPNSNYFSYIFWFLYFINYFINIIKILWCNKKNKQKFFDKGKREILSIILIIIIPIFFSLFLLFIDKLKTRDNISYRFDVRDRCSYWYWLEHFTSIICFGFYWILIFLNVFILVKQIVI